MKSFLNAICVTWRVTEAAKSCIICKPEIRPRLCHCCWGQSKSKWASEDQKEIQVNGDCRTSNPHCRFLNHNSFCHFENYVIMVIFEGKKARPQLEQYGYYSLI